MEKEWPPLKECAQYKCGMLHSYLNKFDWELDEKLLDETRFFYYNSDSEDESEGSKVFYKPRSLKKFVDQVRNSRGYDVDVEPPAFMQSPFWLVKPGSFKGAVSKTIELAIDYITSKTGKPYQLVDTVKYVYSLNKEVASDAEEQTFLATAFASPHALDEESELLECLLKPDGPAPME